MSDVVVAAVAVEPAVDPLKETKELLLALVKVGAFVVERLKDGAQLDDAIELGKALTADGDFKTVVMAGVKDVTKVGAEISPFTVAKGLALAAVIPDLLKELKVI